MKKSDIIKVNELIKTIKELIEQTNDNSSIVCVIKLIVDDVDDTENIIKCYCGKQSEILKCIDIISNKAINIILSGI